MNRKGIIELLRRKFALFTIPCCPDKREVTK